MKCFDKNSNETFDFCFELNEEIFKCFSSVKSHLYLGYPSPSAMFNVGPIRLMRFHQSELDDYLDELNPYSYMLYDLNSTTKRIGLATMLFKNFIKNFPMELYSIAKISNIPSINWHLKNGFNIIKQSNSFMYFKYEI